MILMPTDKKFSSTVSLIFKSYRININFHILKYIKSYSSSFKKVFIFFIKKTHTQCFGIPSFLKFDFFSFFKKLLYVRSLRYRRSLRVYERSKIFEWNECRNALFCQSSHFVVKAWFFFEFLKLLVENLPKKKLNTFENCFGRATTGDWKQWSRVKSLQDWNETIWVCSVFYVFFTVCSRIEQSWRFFFSLV